jgi:hypothetical protein
MLPVGLEPTIPVSERPQTHALDRAATGIDTALISVHYTVYQAQELYSITSSTSKTLSF